MRSLYSLNSNLLQSNGDYVDYISASTGLDNKKSRLEGEFKEKGNKNIDLEDEVLKQYHFRNKDIGLNSPTSDAFIRLKEHGDIEIIANEDTGVLVNPLRKKINLFGDHINLKAHIINHECDPMGFRINNYALNPLFYNACTNVASHSTISDFTIYGHGRVWKSGIQHPGYVREVVEFKPFFPLAHDATQEMLDEQSGWSFERMEDDAY